MRHHARRTRPRSRTAAAHFEPASLAETTLAFVIASLLCWMISAI